MKGIKDKVLRLAMPALKPVLFLSNPDRSGMR
jgi:hypothetical protein